MKSSRFLLTLASAASLWLLAGCPTDSRRDPLDYLRSPVTFRIDPAPADHPFCDDPSRHPFPSREECQATRKYRLLWERPEDTVSFAEYRIYVDTVPPNSSLPWSQIRRDPQLASFTLAAPAAPIDSLLFFLTGSGWQRQAVSRDEPRLLPLDSSGRLDASGRLVFGIVAAYGEGAGATGQPRYTWVITDDRFAPYPLQPAFTSLARTVEVTWERPLDPTSFFEPGADSGIILGYRLRVVRGGLVHGDRPGVPFRPRVTYFVGGVDRTVEVAQNDSFTTVRRAKGWRFWLPDSQRVFSRAGGDPRDSLKVIVTGLSPRDTVDISLWAVDLQGNATDSVSFTRVLLTDTTQPTTPKLRILPGSITRNGFVYAFTASRDRVDSGGVLVPLGQPNANILEYRLSRIRIGGTAGGAPGADSVLRLPAARRNDSLHVDTVRYLPPGAVYRIYVQAVDSSGHLSERDSIDVSTLAAGFSGADSGATCPPGFIAMPSGRFRLGDTSAAAGADERPSRVLPIGSFCIEPYEHRTAAGGFRTRVTWQQAHDICRDLSLSLAPGDSTWLCTEAEWERACEGTESIPLVYGIQSERQDPSGVRFSCNIGTGDSAMAMSMALRNPTCLSHDGAFDMAGNLSEWVMDPYFAGDTSYSQAGDSLIPGRPLMPLSAGSRRGFRGGNYLNPNLSPTLLLRNARCSNRDYAAQSRPRPFAGCLDPDRPLLAVNYADRPPRCLPLPDSLLGRSVSATPARDSTQILLLVQGVAQPIVYQMPLEDPVYQGRKPVSALLTPRSLAVVVFENSQTQESIVDTLDATQLWNASPATQAAVFAREAAPPWSVRMVNGQYDIRYLFAHAQVRNAPAKAYYSNPVLGFRCCSRPRRTD